MRWADRRSRVLALASALAACASPAAPTAPPAPAPPASSAAAEAQAAPAAASAPASASASASPAAPQGAGPERLVQALRPSGQGEAVLLLGIHLEAIEGYTPMFSGEGKPRTDVRPGYRTLLVQARGGSAEIVGELPFLAIPQAEGFVFVGEASVSVHLPIDPKVTLFDGSPKPRDYDATALWQTTSAGQTRASHDRLQARLRRNQAWGTEDTEQIIYASRRALCTVRTESEVTGGALYFRASSLLSLSGVGSAKVRRGLSAHLDDDTFRTFAARLVEVDESDIDFDRPFVYNTFDLIVWRDDVAACLTHGDGALHLTGSVRVSANSARSFSRSRVVGPAPEALAPGHEAVDIEAVRAAVDGATDAFVSPAHDVVLAWKAEKAKLPELVVWDVLQKRSPKALTIPGRIILDEWATGDAAGRWLKELKPLASRRAD